MNTRKIKIIGVGGIGSHLVYPLLQYLSYSGDRIEVTIYDGDTYTHDNRKRQIFNSLQNKAKETVERFAGIFENVFLTYKDEYITSDNVISGIREKDHVFLCVDNHATRKLISERCMELDNVLLINGGNDLTDGDVIVFYRKDGESITKSPTEICYTIMNPDDKNPGDVSNTAAGCQALAASQPQLLFTNLTIATFMLNCYRLWESNKIIQQVFVDIDKLAFRSVPDLNEFELEIN